MWKYTGSLRLEHKLKHFLYISSQMKTNWLFELDDRCKEVTKSIAYLSTRWKIQSLQ